MIWTSGWYILLSIKAFPVKRVCYFVVLNCKLYLHSAFWRNILTAAKASDRLQMLNILFYSYLGLRPHLILMAIIYYSFHILKRLISLSKYQSPLPWNYEIPCKLGRVLRNYPWNEVEQCAWAIIQDSVSLNWVNSLCTLLARLSSSFPSSPESQIA
jgi:hypothetical protein